jgi:phospholipase C
MTFDGFEYQNGSIFDALSAAGRSWRVYAGDFTPQVASLKGVDVFDVWQYARFASDVASAGYPIDYTWIEPSYGHVWSDYICGTSQHPLDDVTRGERLLKCTYEALRASPLWDTSLLLVTWDEHGGFYDAGRPGNAPPPDDDPPHDYSQHGFTFGQYGVRVPAVVVSPLVPANLIDHRTYDHSSIPKTVEDVFGLGSLTGRDAPALSAAGLATLDSPRDTPETLPEPAVSGSKRCDPVPPCGPSAPMLKALASEAPTEPLPPAANPDEPVDTEPNLPGVLYVAHLRDMAITPPAEQPARQERLREITTRGQARDYLEEVRQRYLAAGAAGLLPG